MLVPMVVVSWLAKLLVKMPTVNGGVQSAAAMNSIINDIGTVATDKKTNLTTNRGISCDITDVRQVETAVSGL